MNSEGVPGDTAGWFTPTQKFHHIEDDCMWKFGAGSWGYEVGEHEYRRCECGCGEEGDHECSLYEACDGCPDAGCGYMESGYRYRPDEAYTCRYDTYSNHGRYRMPPPMKPEHAQKRLIPEQDDPTTPISVEEDNVQFIKTWIWSLDCANLEDLYMIIRTIQHKADLRTDNVVIREDYAGIRVPMDLWPIVELLENMSENMSIDSIEDIELTIRAKFKTLEWDDSELDGIDSELATAW
jgi:hypothetical protein